MRVRTGRQVEIEFMYATARAILDEIDRVLSGVEMQQVDALLNAIAGAHTSLYMG